MRLKENVCDCVSHCADIMNSSELYASCFLFSLIPPSFPFSPSLSPHLCFVCSFYNVTIPPSFPIALQFPSLPSHICSHCPHPFFPSSISSFSQCQPFCFFHLPLSPPRLSILSPLLLHLPFIYPLLLLQWLASSLLSFPPPLLFLLTRSTYHWAKPAYLHLNKSTSSHSYFLVVSFFSTTAILLATSLKN